MAIENITFDAATQQGLNANQELAKIGQTLQNTGNFIQNEFENQEINEATTLIRDETEKNYRQANGSQKSYDELFAITRDKIEKSASNTRVRRKLQQELDFKYSAYSGEIYKEEQVKIKKQNTVSVLKTMDSNNKEIEAAILANDFTRVEEIKRANDELINNNTLLDPLEKYSMTENFNNGIIKSSLTNMENDISKNVIENFDLTNKSYKQLRDMDLDKEVSKVDVSNLLSNQFFDKIEGGYKNKITGVIISDEQINQQKQQTIGILEQKRRTKLAKFDDERALFNNNLSSIGDLISSGTGTSGAQRQMLLSQAYSFGTDGQINQLNSMFKMEDMIKNETDMSVVKSKSEAMFKNNLGLQIASQQLFVAQRTKEIENPADFYLKNGMIKEQIKMDEGIESYIAQLSQRQKNIDEISITRGISNSNKKYLTSGERAATAAYIESMPPQELSQFLLLTDNKMGKAGTQKFLNEVYSDNPEKLQKLKLYAPMVLETKNEDQTNIASKTIFTIEQGSKVDRGIINKDILIETDIQLTEDLSGIPFASVDELNMKKEAVINFALGAMVERGIPINDQSKIPEEILKEGIDKVFGKRAVLNDRKVLMPQYDQKTFTETLEKLEDGELDYSFFESVNKPQGVDIKTIIDGFNGGGFTLKDTKVKVGNEFKTYYIPVDASGNTFKGDNGKVYMIDLQKGDEKETDKRFKMLLNENEEGLTDIQKDQKLFLGNTSKAFKDYNEIQKMKANGQYIDPIVEENVMNMMREDFMKYKKENPNADLSDMIKSSYGFFTDDVVEFVKEGNEFNFKVLEKLGITDFIADKVVSVGETVEEFKQTEFYKTRMTNLENVLKDAGVKVEEFKQSDFYKTRIENLGSTIESSKKVVEEFINSDFYKTRVDNLKNVIPEIKRLADDFQGSEFYKTRQDNLKNLIENGKIKYEDILKLLDERSEEIKKIMEE